MPAIKLSEGDKIVTKDGRSGIVASFESLKTGQRGRPKTMVKVRLNDNDIEEIATLGLADLKIA